MSDDTTPQDGKAMSPASAGSRSVSIDVEELICELHHIAGSERIDTDVRRVACEAESALASLRAWVNELQMNTAEREAIEWISQHASAFGLHEAAKTLRGLLERLG